MALLSPDPVMRFYDNNNNPLVGGQLFTYQAGTSTPAATYTDSSAGTPNSNPVILNARGEANVWLIPGQSYKFVLEDSLGNVIWSVDNINPAPNTGVVNTLTNVAGSNTITAICSGISQYQAGDIFSGMPASSNSGATTLNINGLGPVNVTIGGSALTGGEIVAGKPFVFYYTGSTFELFGMQGQVGDIAPNATNAVNLTGIGNAAAFDARYAFNSVIFPYAVQNLKVAIPGLNSYTQAITADYAVLRNSSGLAYMASAINLTVNANGVVGAPLSVMSTRAASTWYFRWLWYNATNGLTATLDTSSTAPTAPTGYASTDYKCLLAGASRTDASGNSYLLQILTSGRKSQYVIVASSNVTTIPQLLYSTSTVSTWTALGISSVVPTTATKISVIASSQSISAQVATCYVAPNSAYGAATSSTPPQINSAGYGGAINTVKGDMLIESANIYYQTYASTSSDSNTVNCAGWED